MNIEDRLLRLERSNRYYKVALALCLCLFMVSAKDVFIKDEIHVKTLRAERILTSDFTVTNKIYKNKEDIKSDFDYYYNIDSTLIAETRYIDYEGAGRGFAKYLYNE